MKVSKLSFLGALAMSIIFSFCSENAEPVKNNPQSGAINSFFNTIPDWEIEEVVPEDDVFKEDIVVQGDETSLSSYTCSVYEREIVATIKNFVSVGTNFGTIWPGALIQGNSLETGELKLITTNRAPITLTTNIALDQTSKTIQPNSVNAQQAIADFMIAAGEMPEGSQAGAGTMNFLVEEAHTFEQSMLSMGISAGFTEPQSQVGLNGSLTVDKNRTSMTHTVVAKFVQEMFTVRIADDLLPTPADFFSTDFTTDDLEALENSGVMGADNIPIYIESVTYGRILLFSMESKSAESVNKLSAALEASMDKYGGEGGGQFTKEDSTVLSTVTHKIFSAGGTDEGANAAIANLDWSKFFIEAPASTAVPISFVARTLNGKKVVGLVNSTIFERRDACSLIEEPVAPTAKSYDIIVKWTDTENTGLCIGEGRFGSCAPSGYVKLERELSTVALTAVNDYERRFTITPNADGDNISTNDKLKFTIRSTSRVRTYGIGGFLGAPTSKTTSNTFNPVGLSDGTFTRKQTMSNIAGSTTLVYTITMHTNY